MRLSLLRTTFLAAALLWAGAATAVPIAYEVEVDGQQGGFQFSYIHTASGGAEVDGVRPIGGGAPVDDVLFKYSGNKVFSLSGDITGLLDGAVLTLDNDIVLDAAGIGGGFLGQDWSLTLNPTGSADTLTVVGPGDLMEGTIDYVLSNDAGPESVSGTFYLFAVDFPGPANELTAAQLAVWANNWDNTVSGTAPTVGGLNSIGLDIRAQGTVIPEPSGFIVFGIGALVASAGAAARRKQQAEA